MVGTLSGLDTERQSPIWRELSTACGQPCGQDVHLFGSLWNVACDLRLAWCSRVETSRRGGLGRPILGVVWAPWRRGSRCGAVPAADGR